MFPIQTFLDIYGSTIAGITSTEELCIIDYINGRIQYTEYNEKLEIIIPTPSSNMFTCNSLIYDECMDWVVLHKCGRHGIDDVRRHFKQVSKDNKNLTQELYRQILQLKENVVFEHRMTLLRAEWNAKT